MAEIRAFRGVRYNPAELGDIGSVVAPPYDVVSPPMRERLAGAHPHNVIRLELPEADSGQDAYATAATLYRQWLTSAVLLREAAPALYPYAQTYRLPSGEERTRAGFLAALRLHEYDEGVVLPHEQTLPKAKEDRFRLLSAAQAQFSPIFGIYDPGETRVRAWLDEWMAAEPAADLTDGEGVRHRLWVSTDEAANRRLMDTLAPLQVFIVDGHHRYETALRHRQERGAGAEWANYVMIYLVALNDTGLVVLPTHRIVTGLAGVDWDAVRHRLAQWFDFDTHPIPLTSGPVQIAEAATASMQSRTILPTATPAELQERITGAVAEPPRSHTFAMLAPPFERLELLTLRDPAAVDARVGAGRAEAWRRLDVVKLHELVLAEALGIRETRGEGSGVTYSRDAVEVVEAVLDQPDRAAFFVLAPRVEDVREVALAGEKMPEKSTYFWPKAITGLVIYDSHSMG
jgi:uncharacterized protein (DUF1015 family)